MNFRQRIHKSQDKHKKIINIKIIPNLISRVQNLFNKNQKSDKMIMPSISLVNKKNINRNFSANKIEKYVLFGDKYNKPKFRLVSALPNKNGIRKNYSIENFKANNSSNKYNNFLKFLRNNEFKGNRLTTAKKEKEIKCPIRPFSSYHKKINEEKKNIIEPKNLFNKLKNNYQINAFPFQKNRNRISSEKKIIESLKENKNNKKTKFILKQYNIDETNSNNKKKETKDKEKNIKEEEKEKISIRKDKKEEREKKIRIEKEEKKRREEEEKKRIEKEEKKKKEKERKRREDEEKKKKEEERKKREEEEKKRKEEEKEKKRKEEEKEKKRKEDEEKQKGNLAKDVLKTDKKSPKKSNSIFDTTLCDEVVSSLPKREKTTLNDFKKIIKLKTENLSEKERAFILFKWIGENVDYDLKNYNLGKRVDCSKEGVFKSGKTVCSGFANLYQDIALYLDLNVVCIPCYAKGAGYIPGEKITALSTNHEYNAINLDGKWYPIDATWGAGHSIGNKYIREFNKFYFLADPELLIKTHFPSDEKWQLTEKTYKLSEFEKWPQVHSQFYQYGFKHFYPEEGYFELNNTNSSKFIVFGENMKKKSVMCSICLLGDNNKEKKIDEKISFVNFFDDKIEISCWFNKKGKYLVHLLGNKGDSAIHTSIISYTVKVAKDSKNVMTFPETYQGHELINIIQPLNGCLKSGEKVKFKMISDIKEILIRGDGIDETLVKNKEGFFEKDIIIKGKPGGKIKIMQSFGLLLSTYYIYNIV